MPVPRQLLTPKWMVSHVIMVSLVLLAIVLGFWQLDRWDEKKSIAATIDRRVNEPAEDLRTLAEGLTIDGGEEVEYRPAVAEGTFDPEEAVSVVGRTRNGRPGSWLVMPLVLDGGPDAVLVNLGWYPLGAEPPAREVTTSVTGLARNTELAQGLQNADPAEGILDEVARVDIARLQQQSQWSLLPVYLQANTPYSSEIPAAALTVLDPPAPDNGPHFSYAMQWFTFAVIGTVGYGLVLRRLGSGNRAARADVPDWDT